MKNGFVGIFILLCHLGIYAQQPDMHTEKFEQLEYELPDPNIYRNAAGAPGPNYWQNQADYNMSLTLDDASQRISGKETITYHNQSPDVLNYLWLQLEQNIRAKNAQVQRMKKNTMRVNMSKSNIEDILPPTFEGGYQIEHVKDQNGNPLTYLINETMMSVDLPKPLKSGDSIQFEVAWSYNINNIAEGGRSGYEYFEQDGNYIYTIAQFFPRMCVYNDVEGWQNKQFLGSGEFALPFGDYRVEITVPDDHVLAATGTMLNPEEVLTETQITRYEQARTADTIMYIVTPEEARENEQTPAVSTKTWIFEADSVRDFAFATSRKFMWDARGVDIAGNIVMAESLYPNEANPLWREYSTAAVIHTLEFYSDYTFPYPYEKAISVNIEHVGGMEYPMICFNQGRPDAQGRYGDQIKYWLIGVVIHEVGHNFFPMIVNSDERQWTWMDEGINTFVETLAELEWEEDFPARGIPAYMPPYMSIDQDFLSPIMTNSEQVQNFGYNAYIKPAAGLMILRNTIMGPELFDRAFKTYSQRWAFKHPTPADFFRTMEDASGVDLDWFWRGWFYKVEPVDIAITNVTYYKVKGSEEFPELKKKEQEEDSVAAKYLSKINDFATFDSYDDFLKDSLQTLHFYEVTFENVGGMVMPVIVQLNYVDGSSETIKIPVEVWRRNDRQFTDVFTSNKQVLQIVLDPYNEVADIEPNNNYWPEREIPSRLQQFKAKQSLDR